MGAPVGPLPVDHLTGDHNWHENFGLKISTCTKCGVLKVETLNMTRYFVQLGTQYSGCVYQHSMKEWREKRAATSDPAE